MNKAVKPFFPLVFMILILNGINLKADVNYDTAWTFVYDGGKLKNGSAIPDNFYDIRTLLNGDYICVGLSCDTSSALGNIIVIKLSEIGKILWKKLYKNPKYNQYANSLIIGRNGDLIIGGRRLSAPLIMRTDSIGFIKWESWYYDSISDLNILQNHLLLIVSGKPVEAA